MRTYKHQAPLPRVKEFCFDSNYLGFISAGLSNMDSYEKNAWYNLSGHYYYFVTDLLPAIWAPMKNCLLADLIFLNYGDLSHNDLR